MSNALATALKALHFPHSRHFDLIDFWFSSNWKEYDRSDSFPYYYESSRKSKGKLLKNQKKTTALKALLHFPHSRHFDQKSWQFSATYAFLATTNAARMHVFSARTLGKLYFHFLSNWMEYDRGDSFPFDFWTKLISIWCKIERKTVTTIIFHSIWK